MALVKVLVSNLFAGAGFQKLEAGQVYDVEESVAEKWLAQGNAEKATEKKGEKLTLKPSRTPITSTQKFTYKSSNKKIATVSSKGVIKGKKTGKAKITVKSGKKKYTVTVLVTK